MFQVRHTRLLKYFTVLIASAEVAALSEDISLKEYQKKRSLELWGWYPLQEKHACHQTLQEEEQGPQRYQKCREHGDKPQS